MNAGITVSFRMAALMDNQPTCEASSLGGRAQHSTCKLLRRAGTDPKHISKHLINIPVLPVQEFMCSLYYSETKSVSLLDLNIP